MDERAKIDADLIAYRIGQLRAGEVPGKYDGRVTAATREAGIPREMDRLTSQLDALDAIINRLDGRLTSSVCGINKVGDKEPLRERSCTSQLGNALLLNNEKLAEYILRLESLYQSLEL